MESIQGQVSQKMEKVGDGCVSPFFGKWSVEADGKVGKVSKKLNFTLMVSRLL